MILTQVEKINILDRSKFLQKKKIDYKKIITEWYKKYKIKKSDFANNICDNNHDFIYSVS